LQKNISSLSGKTNSGKSRWEQPMLFLAAMSCFYLAALDFYAKIV
jgi:hypothetical protein